MAFDRKMKPEEATAFFERWRKIGEGFNRLDQQGQAKVMDMTAKRYWRALSKKSMGRLTALKVMCRILDEKDELKIEALIEQLEMKQQKEGNHVQKLKS